jgi:hypothetical protein
MLAEKGYVVNTQTFATGKDMPAEINPTMGLHQLGKAYDELLAEGDLVRQKTPGGYFEVSTEGSPSIPHNFEDWSIRDLLQLLKFYAEWETYIRSCLLRKRWRIDIMKQKKAAVDASVAINLRQNHGITAGEAPKAAKASQSHVVINYEIGKEAAAADSLDNERDRLSRESRLLKSALRAQLSKDQPGNYNDEEDGD